MVGLNRVSVSFASISAAALVAPLALVERSDAFAPSAGSAAAPPAVNGAAGMCTNHHRRHNHHHHRLATAAASQPPAQPSPACSGRRQLTAARRATVSDVADGEEWLPLVDADDEDEFPPVCKHVMEEGGGSGAPPGAGSTVELEYTGTLLGERDWSAMDVVECWLSNLQGLDHLTPRFLDNDIDASVLMDESSFTEEYCMQTLGIENKIQAKKLVMASKRLAKQQEDYPPGYEFDSSASRGKNYSFVLGAGKVIRAMELAVSTMRVGERAMLVCRSDYAYGPEGLRTSKGDVIVPPFATLCFDLRLVSATP